MENLKHVLLAMVLTSIAFPFLGLTIKTADAQELPHVWLEAYPGTYEAIKPARPFNVSILIQNVSESDGLIGVQFEVKYNVS